MAIENKINYYEHFTEFVAIKLGIGRSTIPKPSSWSESGNTVGALALKLGVLTTEAIDRVLIEQQEQSLKFIEASISLGLMNRKQSEQILHIQLLHKNQTLLEMMLLNDQINIEDIWKILSECEPPL